MNNDKIIYLDLEFISFKYEEIYKIDPKVVITRQQSSKAGISVFFADAGIASQEARAYSITSRKMLHEIWQYLQDTYQPFSTFKNYTGTRVAWMEGELTLARWGKDVDSYEFYELKHGAENTAFLTSPSYFTSGFDRIFSASTALKGNIGIPVKCLSRILWHVDDAKNYVACPYVIIENS